MCAFKIPDTSFPTDKHKNIVFVLVKVVHQGQKSTQIGTKERSREGPALGTNVYSTHG